MSPHRDATLTPPMAPSIGRRIALAMLGPDGLHPLGDYRWFRRLAGGHWERWYIDVVHSDMWHRKAHDGVRPSSIARGTPTCEDWP